MADLAKDFVLVYSSTDLQVPQITVDEERIHVSIVENPDLLFPREVSVDVRSEAEIIYVSPGIETTYAPVFPPLPSNAPERFSLVVELNADLLPQETAPGAVRVPVPNGFDLNTARRLEGLADGREMPEGYGWRPAADGLAFELYLPTDARERAIYLNARILFELAWYV